MAFTKGTCTEEVTSKPKLPFPLSNSHLLHKGHLGLHLGHARLHFSLEMLQLLNETDAKGKKERRAFILSHFCSCLRVHGRQRILHAGQQLGKKACLQKQQYLALIHTTHASVKHEHICSKHIYFSDVSAPEQTYASMLT